MIQVLIFCFTSCVTFFIFSIISFKLYEYKFLDWKILMYDKELEASIMGILSCISGAITAIGVFVMMLVALFESASIIPKEFLIYFCINMFILIGYLVYLICFSFRGKYACKYIEIEKLRKQITEIDNSFNNKEAVKLLNESLKKLNKELESILISETIKKAKKIEISFKKDIIRKELDELEALQSLNETK